VSRFRATALRGQHAEAPFLAEHTPGGVRRWDWGGFWRLVAGFTARLATAQGHVVLVAASGAAPIAAFVAAIAAGRVVSFFPPPHPIQDSDYYRAQQQAALARLAPGAIWAFDAAVAAALREAAPDFAALVTLAEAEEAPGWAAARDAFAARLEGGGLLFLQHSSGTTGIKKAVPVSAPMLAAQFTSYWQGCVAALAPRPAVASWLPLYHDMGLVAATLLPLLAAAPISLVDPFAWVTRPQLLLDAIEADAATLCWMPNFAFRHYLRLQRALKPRRLESVRAWINCSEPCRLPDAAAFEQGFAAWGVTPGSVLGCYAMAETVFAVSQALPGPRRALAPAHPLLPGEAVPAEWLGATGSVQSSGAAVPGMAVAAYHAGARLPEGSYGELGVAADCLFPGYHGAEAVAAPFLTGDLGAVLEGEVFVFGRLKDVIIVNGRNLFAGDIEAAISSVPGVKPGRAVAFGVANAATGTEDLVVVAERDAALDLAEDAIIGAALRLLDASFQVRPKALRLVAERWLVKSTSGKISREANRARWLAEEEDDRPVHA
jgi:acyl-CoA synthetase (AMP-forming)/AMP-acid ligase II